MRILFLSHCVPYPPDKGDKVRAFHQIRWLSRKHEVHLLAIAKTPEDLRHESSLRQWCSEVELFPLASSAARLRAAASLLAPGTPFTHAYFRSPELAQRLQSLRSQAPPDIVFAYTAAMGPFAERCSPAVGSCIDLVDVDSAKWEHYARSKPVPLSWIFGIESRRLRRYEQSIADRFDTVFVTTDRERETLRQLSPAVDPIAIRNGVDTDYFSHTSRAEASAPRIVFTGQMDYYPNEDAVLAFADAALPELLDRYPDLGFDVVGRAPGPRLRKLGARPEVRVTGEVSDIRPFLDRAWVFVAPLRIARGVQNKVLEAAACEVPIVCSPGVFSGLADGGFRDGEHLLVAKDDADYVEQIGRLIDQPDLRALLGKRARRLLSTNYSWNDNMKHLESGIERQYRGRTEAVTVARG